MVSFHEVRFPADISFKATGGPEFKTDIVTLGSGHEKHNIIWSYPRARYELNFKDISKAQSNKVLAFFMARKARAYGFRFKDWNDFEAKNQILGVGDGTKTQFEMVKDYQDEIQNFSRRIFKPVEGNVDCFVDNISVTDGLSVDFTAGTINFSTPPAIGVVISADFQFDVPVRFNSDFLGSGTESYDDTSMKKIQLIEIKV